jgi:signal transduction histidine kinase/ActR/RegA family two-component response regulator
MNLRAFVAKSVRTKVMAVVMTTTLVALLVNAVVLLMYEANAYRGARTAELHAQVEILGRAAAPALAFNDRKEADAALASMKARGDVVRASLYRPDGSVFATYNADPDSSGDLRVRQPIVEGGQPLGFAEVVARSKLHERILAYAGIVLGVMVLALGAALVLSVWLQRVITRPIMDIDVAARSVVERDDYAVRARKSTDDEIGALAGAFNRMLEEIDRRTSELARSEAALRVADRRKDEFLATLAHELRNPLAPIRNGLYLLKMAPPGDPAAAAARQMMERQLNQMVRLIDDLLDVARIATDKIALKREWVDAATVARSALEAVEPAARARRHELTVSLPAQPLHLSADPTRLAQVFLNLLSNAIKFTEPGGKIAFVLAEEEGALVARVRDNGIGLAEDQLEPIFEMFNQADRSFERTVGGLGVGLALSRRLVELHGGTIEARSDGPGKGAEFTVRIPGALGGPPAEAGHPADKLQGAAPTARVLIVDDNEDFAASLATLLRRHGNEVRVEHDSRQGLAVAEEFRPDCALLDIGMPGMNGYELARRLRGAIKTRNAILIAMTGYGQPGDRAAGREVGFDHYLVKPVEVEHVLELLRSNPTWPSA